jgi:hypothetical protein
MIMDFTQESALKLDVRCHVKGMIEEFPCEIKATTTAPWTEKSLKIQVEDSKKLEEEQRSIFHTCVMKGMFLCKRARPDIDPAIAFLSSRVNDTSKDDWKKSLRVLGFLKGTINDALTLEADDTNTLTWCTDAAFAAHADVKSHTGAVFTMGKGAVISSSTKQKVSLRSSTKSELASMDAKMSKALWVKRFLKWQGFKVKLNAIYQDNTSTVKLGENGKSSSGKRTRHFDVKHFHVTDLVDCKELKIEHCSTEAMIADCMTKPLTGGKFKLFRDRIVNLSGKHHRIEQQECVGRKVSFPCQMNMSQLSQLSQLTCLKRESSKTK